MSEKKVKSFDGKDVGKVKSITPEIVELKDGDERYFVQKLLFKEHDKDLYMLLMEDEVRDKYQRKDLLYRPKFKTPYIMVKDTIHIIKSFIFMAKGLVLK